MSKCKGPSDVIVNRSSVNQCQFDEYVHGSQVFFLFYLYLSGPNGAIVWSISVNQCQLDEY